MQYATDQDLEGLLKVCEGLGFRTDLIPRQPNLHPNGTLLPENEQQLRRNMGDYAEFIVPVFWSSSEFVGLKKPGDVSSLVLMEHCQKEIIKAGLKEGQSAPLPYRTKPGYQAYEGWAYARNSVSGSSDQANAPGLRRQGYLVVGRKMVSVVGLYSDFQATPTWRINPSNGDPHYQYVLLAYVLPPNTADLKNIKELGYGELETVRPIELVRFDGLAALMKVAHFFDLEGPDKKSRKWLEQTREWLETIPAPIRSIARVLKYAEAKLGPDLIGDMFLSEFDKACDEIMHGITVASGTGVNKKGRPNRFLFTSALGLAFESSVDGTKIFVESPFIEIDTAWELIAHNIKSMNQESNTSAQQVSPVGEKFDLTGELAKLASLHKSGVLSDDEFAAAKAAVIGSANR